MLTGVLLSAACAAVWGTGDFCGGRASTKLDAYHVLGLSALSGLAMLALLTVATGEAFPPWRGLLPAVGAGLSTSLGIACLYRGLSLGSAAVVAPTAAVVAALVPVLYAGVTQGAPRATQLVGFALALVGIFLVARAAPSGASARTGIRLGLWSGVGFGGFLVLIAWAPPGSVYLPLAVSRTMMFLVSITLLFQRGLPFPAPTRSPLGLLAGMFDAAGTALYLLAQSYVRLDVAAVISSLYPAATVVLSRVLVQEHVSRDQWVGATLCVAAVALIAL